MENEEAHIIQKFNRKLSQAFTDSGGFDDLDILKFSRLWEELESEFGLDEVE